MRSFPILRSATHHLLDLLSPSEQRRHDEERKCKGRIDIQAGIARKGRSVPRVCCALYSQRIKAPLLVKMGWFNGSD